MWNAMQRLRWEQRVSVVIWAVLLLLWLLLGWLLGVNNGAHPGRPL